MNTLNAHALPVQTETSYWSAVFSLFMGVTSLIAAEFIPVSLLTPMAHDLGITEGMAGQAVTVVGLFSVFSSLLVAPLAGNTDRKNILLVFSLLLAVSNMLVAVAPNYVILLLARSLPGICVGGLLALVTAVTLQLVPEKDLSRALSIVYAGVSVAIIISLPLASTLWHQYGWGNVFWLASIMGIIMFVWQWLAMPSLPACSLNTFCNSIRNMVDVLRERWVTATLPAVFLAFVGGLTFDTVGMSGNVVLTIVFLGAATILTRICFSLHTKTTLAALALLMLVSAPGQAGTPMTVRFIIGSDEMLIDLFDNPAAKAFAVQLPLTLPFKDYVGAEKIATLPQRLLSGGSPSASEIPTDFTYYAPWGNLAIFYRGVGDDGQLLALGRIRTGKALLARQRGDFTATLELVP